MNIVHVIRDIDPAAGGPVAAIFGLVAAQSQFGHDVSLVTTDYRLNQHPTMDASVTLCHCIFAPWRYAPSMRLELQRKIQNADVVHVHTTWEYPTLLAIKLSKRLSTPCIMRPCGMLDKWSLSQKSLKKKLYLKIFSRTLFHSNVILHFTTEAERSKSCWPDSLETFVMGNGLSGEAFAEKEMASEFFRMYPKLMNKKLVLFLARLDSKKQPDVVIRSFSMIAPIFPGVHLVIAGPGEKGFVARLKRQAEALGIIGSVTFTGMLSGLSLHAAYRAATVYVLPSLQENFGITVAEAMAGSCPVIISDQVDIKDIVENTNAGIVCSPSVDGVVPALMSILASPEKAQAMGQNGRRAALREFSWGHIANKLGQVYHALQHK